MTCPKGFTEVCYQDTNNRGSFPLHPSFWAFINVVKYSKKETNYEPN